MRSVEDLVTHLGRHDLETSSAWDKNKEVYDVSRQISRSMSVERLWKGHQLYLYLFLLLERVVNSLSIFAQLINSIWLSLMAKGAVEHGYSVYSYIVGYTRLVGLPSGGVFTT